MQYEETRRTIAAAEGPPLLYGGIDDAWLAAMERSLRPRRRLERIYIPLSRDEAALLRRLERALDVEKLVGRRGAALLRDGRKIELEGATNPTLHPSRHRRWVFRHLRALAAI